jgi:hypothetical protein
MSVAKEARMAHTTIALALLVALTNGCGTDSGSGDGSLRDGGGTDAARPARDGALADGATPTGDLARSPGDAAAQQADLAVAAPDAAAKPDAAAAPDAAAKPDAATPPDMATAAPAAHDFPRLGSYYIGGSQSYDAAFQTWAARFHVDILGGDWEGWEQGRGYTKEDVIKSIKAQSTIDSKVFQYVNLNEEPQTRAASWMPTYFDEVQAENWWVYVKGTSGTKAASSYNNAWGVIDMTAAAPRDPQSGLGPYGWGARFVNDLWHLGKVAGTSAAPSLDGFFLDNVFMYPRSTGDWNRDGVTDSSTDPTVESAFRTGEKEFYDEMQKLWPNSVQLGNAGDDFGNQIESGGSVAPLAGVPGGGVLEGNWGESWSVESWGGAAKMMRWYHDAMNSFAAPKYMVLGHDHMRSDGSDPSAFDQSGNPTAYYPAWQGMRNGLAATLMDDGYYFANLTYAADTQAERLWFDEFDGGGLGVGYLGQPTQAPQTAAWSNGVWKREFQHGIVLWSPKGSGVRTVSLAGLGNLKRIKGAQAPAVNSGAQVTGGMVTLQDRDGLILLRY